MHSLFSPPDDLRVLHVDDDAAFLDLAADCLGAEADEFEILQASRPGEALTRLGDERVDCLVSDYEMPRMDGLELLDRVRDRDEAVPFILFTGEGSEDIAADAIEAGVDGYLRKEGGTTQFTVLAQRVRSQVERAREHQRAENAERTYELVARAATDAFWVRDLDTGETAYSDGIRRFGYEPGVRQDGFEWWVEKVHPENRAAFREMNAAQVAGEDAAFDEIEGDLGRFSHEYRWRRADGSYARCLSRGFVRFEEDEPDEMIGAMTDLSSNVGSLPDDRE